MKGFVRYYRTNHFSYQVARFVLLCSDRLRTWLTNLNQNVPDGDGQILRVKFMNRNRFIN